MKKDPFGVFFCDHSDSLNMNDTDFSFIGLVKLNIERPVLGMNPSSLRFVKHMSFKLSSNDLQRVFVTLFELQTMKKRHSSTIMGELREGNHFSNKWHFVITFEHGTCLHIILVDWVFS